MSIEEKRGVVSVIILWSLVPAMVFADLTLQIFKALLPFFPLIAYGIVASFIRSSLLQLLPRKIEHKEFDRQQAASLTLAGFCFTTISMLASFFKEDIKASKTQPFDVMFIFGCALISFVGAYTVLRIRRRRLVDYLSEGLMDTGLWCVFAGLRLFFSFYEHSKIANLFSAAMLVLAAFILRNLYYQVKISQLLK